MVLGHCMLFTIIDAVSSHLRGATIDFRPLHLHGAMIVIVINRLIGMLDIVNALHLIFHRFGKLKALSSPQPAARKTT